ncbi:benzoate 4-monooxygenase [Fusarium sp. NRRL 52700]|nr:benzoate 4-monooxygenase [Fusarium sp. NRRL 52700]
MLLDFHTSTFKTTILAICALSVLKVALSIAYNIFLHPLSKYPGPPLARVSRLWSRIGNFQGRKSERIHEAHVSFRDAEAHKIRRKNFSRGFSQSSMLDFEPHVSSKIKTLLNQWAARANDGPIDVYPWCHWLGFDVIYHLMFDEDPGSVQRGQPHQVMRYIKAWKPTFIYKEFLPQMEQYGVYVPGPVGGYFRDVRTWKEYALTLIEEVRQKDSHTPFLRNVLSAEKSANTTQQLTNSELAEECMGGMFGGSGTTANTFVYILWACLRQPKVVAKLRSELLQAFPDSGSVPDYQTCSKLPYLQAVINETLRRYPTIVATLPRTANNDTIIDGIPVPKGTIVGTQNFTMHRNEDAFPSPEEFIPERWLTTDNNEARKASWTPFSVGSRRCIGINLAQMELSKLTAAFFLRFDGRVDESMTEEDMRIHLQRLTMDAARGRNESGRKVVKRRKIALACEYCRRRKTRCDGRQPACSACEAKGLSATCLYQQGSLTTKRYVSDLEARVQEYERQSQAAASTSNLIAETTVYPNLSPTQDSFLGQVKDKGQRQIRQESDTAIINNPSSISYGHLDSFPLNDKFPTPPRTDSVNSDAMVVVPSPECGDSKDLGQSSSISFIQSMLRTVTRNHTVFRVSHHPDKRSYPFLQTIDEETLFLPPRRIADDFVQAYWKFLHPILPILHRPTFMGLYDRLWMEDDATGSGQICNVDDAVFFSTLNIVLAIGCQFSEQMEPTRQLTMASKLYQRSKALLADELLDHPNLALVQLLLLTGVYLQSTEYANRCWNIVGSAIRSAQSIGLHLDRKRSSTNQLERELERRVWHACVFLDRTTTSTCVDESGVALGSRILHSSKADAFACVVVLAAARLYPMLSVDVDKESIQASWSQSMRVFDRYKLQSPAASHVIKMLEVLESRFPAFEPAFNNLPFEAKIHTGERNSPAEQGHGSLDDVERIQDSDMLLDNLQELDFDSTWAILDDLLQCESSVSVALRLQNEDYQTPRYHFLVSASFAAPGGRGSYPVSGLGARKQAILDAGGNALDLAIAVLEDQHMSTNYKYSDGKTLDAANFGVFKVNWGILRVCAKRAGFVGQSESQWNNGAKLNSDIYADVASCWDCQEYYGYDRWFADHRHGATGLTSPNTEDIRFYRESVEWIKN